MKRRIVRKLVLTVCIISLAAVIQVPAALTSAAGNAAAGNLNSDTIKRDDTYDSYLSKYSKSVKPQYEISIPVDKYSDSNMKVELLDNFQGSSGMSIKTLDEGYVTWEVNIPQEGMYNISIEYFPIEGHGASMERAVYINDELPFTNAGHLLFYRVWSNATEIKRDNRGNDIRPRQVEVPTWQQSYFKDYMGYYNEPYQFYFKAGLNTVKLESAKEPMVIKSLKITQYKEVPAYEEVLKTYKEKGYTVQKAEPVMVQGESGMYKSDPTLYPINDRSSPATMPYDKSKIRLNTIGGYRWINPGELVTWNVEVDKPGLYQIAIKGRQNITRGIYTNRRLTINGRVPFKEVESIPFTYSSTWENFLLGNGDEPYLFYLDKGVNEIKLEVVLGDLADILRVAEDSVFILNNAYRQIVMITGQTPDQYRDYQLDTMLPGVIATMEEQSRIIGGLSEKLINYTGQRSSNNSILERLSYQLKDMVKDPRSIQSRLKQFGDNVGALSTWILNTRKQPLEIDYIMITSPDEKLPDPDASFLQRVLHEFRSYIASFTEDYNTIGDVYNDKKAITVWICSGRDQSQIVKQMIDDFFTPEKGIQVNLQLVSASVLLPSTVAGKAPDVAMYVSNGEPVNFATRNAAVDLTQFSDFDPVSKRFQQSAMVPYKFEKGVYALPEQQSFPMLFYRKDILKELNLKVPQTWEDIFEILPEIQKNNMDISVPVTNIDKEIQTGESKNYAAGMATFITLLYQRGGSLYIDDGKASGLNTETGIEAFKKWTDLYVNYKFPTEFTLLNRFRTGEIPVAINDYDFYNSLQVSAPELRGLWEFAPIPGIRQKDGTIDRSSTSGGHGVMMLKSTKNKEASWEFMKWWTSTEIQTKFAREMESLLGAAARQPTANIEALQQLPWPAKDYKALAEQWKWARGNPEVPGGYFTPRHMNNAFRKVINSGDDPRETFLDYVRIINGEIDNKRKEFGLELRKGGE